MHQPIVSIVINNYNYAGFLAEAIDSGLRQTYPHVEVVVADDGSTDRSAEIMASYGDRIISVYKANGGQASAMNAGFVASTGDLVIFLDADDYLFPEAAERIVEEWETNRAIAQIQYRLELVDEVGKFLEIHPIREAPLDSGNVLPTLLARGRYGTTVTSGLAFSRAALQQSLPIPEADFIMSADGYLVTVLPFYGPLAAIEEPLGAYRKHGNNLWSFSSDAIPVDRFRKTIQHELQKYRYLVKTAESLGYTPATDLGFRDYIHLTSRLASLKLEPKEHPVSTDSVLELAYRGCLSIWRDCDFKWTRKLFLTGWFLWVGLMPKPLAESAIAWLMASSARPAAIDWVLKRIRSLTK
ncbi:glycosyltransferase family 2 protein [Leptolyngbya sp. AN02str]|uniref:glycosyltransferase family 2 protein n=1 Tax=Leptolyngbya sp. AN02str TaxID=3423363 RepID=UPI003D311F3C